MTRLLLELRLLALSWLTRCMVSVTPSTDVNTLAALHGLALAMLADDGRRSSRRR